MAVWVLIGCSVVSYLLAAAAWAHLTWYLGRGDAVYPPDVEHATPSHELASYEPHTPRLDQLRLIGRTAADA
ncbi:MAG: hypothetical protein KDB24_15295, partial [Microthrixaceae bacterium]|nr:hypothetical protein [Microthrixaceae bacterium]